MEGQRRMNGVLPWGNRFLAQRQIQTGIEIGGIPMASAAWRILAS